MKKAIVFLAFTVLLFGGWKAADAQQTDPLEHFTCYWLSGGTNVNQDVNLKDQFFPNPGVDTKVIYKPVMLCAPTNKNNEGFVTTLGPNGTHLLCYAILPKAGANTTVTVSDQFAEHTVRVGKQKLLCVPAQKRGTP
jgi:hypothetical protein